MMNQPKFTVKIVDKDGTREVELQIYIMIVLKENIVETETKKNKERVFFS